MQFTKSEAEALIAKAKADHANEVVLRKGQFSLDKTGEKANVIDLHKRKSSDARVIEFQKRCDDLFIVSTLLGRPAKELNLYKSFKEFVGNETELAKAMGTGVANGGAEWIPTDFSSELINMVTLQLRVAALFPRIAMPTDPFKIPGKKSFSTARLGTQSTAPSASSVGTRQITLSAIKLIDYVPVSYELDEDSIIAMLPIVKEDIAESLARAEENAVLNGDTTGTHMDSDVTASDDQRKAWKGLRKLALANNFFTDMSTFNGDTLSALMTNMGKYGATPSMLALIAGVKGSGKLRTLRDADGNALMTTVDKLGPRATILTGMVGEIYGMPVITSEFIREDVNANGVYDGVTDDYGTIQLVRKDGFVFGDRRKMMIETFRDIKSQNIDIVASSRIAFESRYDITTESVTWMGHKVS